MGKATVTFEDEDGEIRIRTHFDPPVVRTDGGSQAQKAALMAVRLLLDAQDDADEEDGD
jgi:hypothetical protein